MSYIWFGPGMMTVYGLLIYTLVWIKHAVCFLSILKHCQVVTKWTLAKMNKNGCTQPHSADVSWSNFQIKYNVSQKSKENGTNEAYKHNCTMF